MEAQQAGGAPERLPLRDGAESYELSVIPCAFPFGKESLAPEAMEEGTVPGPANRTDPETLCPVIEQDRCCTDSRAWSR